ncbi:MAG: MFS transporter [bacterium]|nr:MFS transporter [bacterium]
MASTRQRLIGGKSHKVWTIVVFVILASLDNAAIAIVPAMILPTAEALNTSSRALGFITGVVILTTAITSVAWGYWGDRSDRKRLLFGGTLLWALGSWLSGGASAYWQLFLWQFVMALGLGAIATVGFSVISDFVSPRRRGLAMSFWGLSQGIGGLFGAYLASQAGSDNFRTPLRAIAVLGVIFAVLYLTTYQAPRGYAEPALKQLHDSGAGYQHQIELAQVPALFDKRTNLWLVLQGFTAQIAYGSLIWVEFLYQNKVLEQGYDSATATKVGGLLGAVFRIGALFSILAGHIGDRLQRRDLSARAKVSAIGLLGAIPFFLVFFFLPLSGIDVTNGASTGTLIPEVLKELVTNPFVAAAFFSSMLALAFTSADSPNAFALISDVNLPEHRGTVFGVQNMINGVGRSVGNALTGPVATALERSLVAPLNWAVGLAIFQVFFIPAGWMYWRAAKTSPGDITETRAMLEERGRSEVVGDRAD